MPRKPTDTTTDLSLRIKLLNYRITCMLEHWPMTPVLAIADVDGRAELTSVGSAP